MRNPFGCCGPAMEVFKHLKTQRVLRWAKIHRVQRGRNLDSLIMGIGQVHPVHRGKFRRSQARAIASVQAWIYELCRYLHQAFSVQAFGQEGFSSGGQEFVDVRLHPDTLSSVQRDVQSKGSVSAFLKSVARDWRRALRMGNSRQVQETTLALNALTILQALEPRVAVFPIEQGQVHGAVGEGIARLHDEIARIESTSAYRSAISKGGKRLTQAEYDALRARNALTKQYNKTLSHPERDRALFREVVERASGRTHDHGEHARGVRGLVVFVLGAAHRRGMLRLAKKYLPDGMMFVWITPPQLWLWKAIVRWMGVVVVLSVVAAVLMRVS